MIPRINKRPNTILRKKAGLMKRSREKPARARGDRGEAPGKQSRNSRDKGGELSAPDKGMERFRIEVGHEHGVKPGNIVGAIANEAEIDAEYIGRIEIYQDHSTVDLPEGMPKEVFDHLKSVWVSGQKLKISRADAARRSKRGRKGPSGKAARAKARTKRQG